MPHTPHFTRIEQAFNALRNPEQAVPMAKYMRDQFVFLGIATPQRREAIKALSLPMLPSDLLFSLVQQLWQQPEREYQYVAIDLLKKHSQQLTLADIGTLQSYVQQQSWWDSVDGLASVIGTAMKRLTQADSKHQDIMDTWLTHDNLWVRRVAMIHQLGWRNHTHEQRLSHYALALAGEKEFFIRKAIGWALRDYARHQPDWVSAFVAQHSALLSPLSAREAMKHL